MRAGRSRPGPLTVQAAGGALSAQDTENSAAQADFDSLSQAAEWYATLRSGTASERERQAWRAWLAQRPEHAAAWRHIEQVSNRFDPLRMEGAGRAAVAGVTAARGAPGRRRVLGGAAGLAGVGLLGWMGWRAAPLPEWVAALRADHHTDVGQRRRLTLADGTQVWLNTRSALDVDYRRDARTLTLLAGEALIETAHDAARRPFYVRTRFGRMQALGTRFTVRLAQDQADLDVFDGAVLVVNANGASRQVPAGRRVHFDGAAISDAQPADRAREAWRRGVLLADNLPLGALAEELGRYRRGHISVAPEVADLAVMGVYPANDPDRALAMLEQALPIRVRQPLPWWVTIQAR